MKKIYCLSIIALFVVAFFSLPTQVSAQASDPEDKVIFGGTFTLESGENLDGSLIIFGGAVSLEEDSEVDGDVVLTGGSLEVSGEINGSITAIGGAVTLSDTATVEGDINSIGGVIKKSDGATVEGNISNQTQGDLKLPVIPGGEPPGHDRNGFRSDWKCTVGDL
ncbi:MAG: polymer-forming cytoskeletal protein [Anaerolineaceae bacterium]